MAIEFSCNNCGRLLRTTEDKVGRQAKCPDCDNDVTVPHPVLPEMSYSFGDESANEEGELLSLNAGIGSTILPPAAGMKSCPMCGDMIKYQAVRCRYCGANVSGPNPTGGSGSYLQPHRGTMILVFGILSLALTCTIFGIIAWVMGNTDLRAMQEGRMDPSGMGATKAGKIVGMMTVCLHVGMILFLCAMFVIYASIGGFE